MRRARNLCAVTTSHTNRSLCTALSILGACTGTDVHYGATAAWVPALTVTADVDDDEYTGGVEFDADLDTGEGFAAALRVDSRGEQIGSVAPQEDDSANYVLEAAYLTSEHHDRPTGATERTHAIFGIASIGTRLGGSAFAIAPRVGAGIGALVFDFDSRIHDTGGPAALVRGVLDIEIGGVVIGEAAIGAFLWGWPGETAGYGGFVSLGGGLRF